VVHGIVGAHGGSIDVESAPGAGTAFTIFFPVLPYTEPAAGADKEVAPAPVPSARTERPLDLLVVDDEDVIVGLLERYFLARGHAVVSAREGAQAIRLAEHASFDVAICDLRMPGMDGTEVIRRLQALPTCANTRFILSTGDTATPAVRERIDALPLAAVVDKPYEMEALRQIVEER
jgi:CheY-like chemotaxis protein